MLTVARDHWLRSNRSAGNGFSAGLSRAAKQAGPRAVAFAERPLVQSHQQFADRLVQFRQIVKNFRCAQRRDDPAFANMHPLSTLALSRGL